MSEAALLPIVRAAAARRGIRPGLLEGLVAQESGWRPDVKSEAGAIGPAQLMPATARELGVDPYDPAQNIEGGAKYLKQQLDRFGGDERLALAAYNAGPGAVEKYGGIPPFAQTQNYVPSVLGKAARYSSGGAPAPGGLSAPAPAANGVAPPSAALTSNENPFQRYLKALVADTMDSQGPGAPASVSPRTPVTSSRREPDTAANNIRPAEGLPGGFFGGPIGFDDSKIFRKSRMAGDALAAVIAPGARRDRAVSPGAASSRDDDPAAAMMTGLMAGLFAPKSAAAQQQAVAAGESSVSRSGRKTWEEGPAIAAFHAETGSGYTVPGARDANGRPVVFSRSAANAFAAMMRDSGGLVKPSDIASAQRSERKNAAVGGAVGSQHLGGNAMDIHGGSHEWIVNNGARYGWHINRYGGHGDHGGHFEFRG